MNFPVRPLLGALLVVVATGTGFFSSPWLRAQRLSGEIGPLSPSSALSEPEVEALAQSITVKVLSGENSGSGILIAHQGDEYQILTNEHVLLYGKPQQNYRIQTPDQKIYPAQTVSSFNFAQQDLGILKFTSAQTYPVAALTSLPLPALGDKVYAGGYPYQSSSSPEATFKLTQGVVGKISSLSFRGGYKIGYTNDVQKGMSGGPLLNQQGQIIGINGRHKYPVWGNPYIFEDGSIASIETKKEMSQYSWAIPIELFLHFAPRFSAKTSLLFVH